MPLKLAIKNCKKHGDVKHRYKPKSDRWCCTRCEIEYLDNFRRKRKELLVDRAGGGCIKCGYKKSIAALAFPNRRPKEKLFALCRKSMTKAWSSILEEFDKCDLVCKNCHAEIHEK